LHFYNKALKINTENAEYWKSVAHAEFKVGNTVSSIDAYEEASKLEPEDKEIWLNGHLSIMNKVIMIRRLKRCQRI
jgi:predicted TPR repeat methyltransferase